MEKNGRCFTPRDFTRPALASHSIYTAVRDVSTHTHSDVAAACVCVLFLKDSHDRRAQNTALLLRHQCTTQRRVFHPKVACARQCLSLCVRALMYVFSYWVADCLTQSAKSAPVTHSQKLFIYLFIFIFIHGLSCLFGSNWTSISIKLFCVHTLQSRCTVDLGIKYLPFRT